MKIIFFLAALANVALFMWEYNKNSEQTTEHSETRVYADLERIVLVSELNRDETGRNPVAQYKENAGNQDSQMQLGLQITPDDKSKEASTQSSEEKSPVVEQTAENETPACYEAGPFADSSVLGIWQKQLAAVEAEVDSVSREGKSVSDYLVYYPSDTPEQSVANLLMLKGQGHNDAWILNQGNEKGGISLGVFKKEERAQAMKSQLQDKGIHVEVMPRYKKQVQKFARIKGESQLQESLKSLEKSYPDVTVKPAENCSEP